MHCKRLPTLKKDTAWHWKEGWMDVKARLRIAAIKKDTASF